LKGNATGGGGTCQQKSQDGNQLGGGKGCRKRMKAYAPSNCMCFSDDSETVLGEKEYRGVDLEKKKDSNDRGGGMAQSRAEQVVNSEERVIIFLRFSHPDHDVRGLKDSLDCSKRRWTTYKGGDSEKRI